MQINGFEWVILRDNETQALVGVCDQLGISLGADTFPDLLELIEEGMAGLFACLKSDGQFEEFFKERGLAVPM